MVFGLVIAFAKKVIKCANWYHNNSDFQRTEAAVKTFVFSELE
jgi:hypothetical protein